MFYELFSVVVMLCVSACAGVRFFFVRSCVFPDLATKDAAFPLLVLTAVRVENRTHG